MIFLKDAVEDFEGHALALTLLGRYLATVLKGDIRQRDKIAALTRERSQGAHARRVMESYAKWFKGKPELDILHVMGLFDHPVEQGALQALLARPAIKGLTSKLTKFSQEDRQYTLLNLRQARLLADEDPLAPDTLDAHPLVREHFGQMLQKNNPAAWKKAHSRLYEHYKAQAPELPDTLEEMAPLYAAVAHGCHAGRHQQAYDEIYRDRIRRGNEYFSTKKLGAFGADLAVLSGFFDPPWRKPLADLREDAKPIVLNLAGYCLRALGRLAEAVQPMQVGLEAYIAQNNWHFAAIIANNLSELYLTIGDLAQALAYGRQTVDLSDRSGDVFERLSNRTTLADALHQSGSLKEAEAIFREAEEMQKKRQVEYPLLYSLSGFQYCDLLLGQGKYRDVQDRAAQTLEWAHQAGLSLLTIALDHLSLGRAHLFEALQKGGTGDFSQAAEHLDHAVDGLWKAGTQDHLPRGLLARAALHRVRGDFQRAQHDLDEATSIAQRSGMGLHQADAYLEYARLHLAKGETDKARDSLATAKEMVENMGYHRRDPDLADLEMQLGRVSQFP